MGPGRVGNVGTSSRVYGRFSVDHVDVAIIPFFKAICAELGVEYNSRVGGGGRVLR